MRTELETGVDNVASTIFYFIEDLELLIQDSPLCGLTFDDITFILFLFADDMVLLGKIPWNYSIVLICLMNIVINGGLKSTLIKRKSVAFRNANERWTYNGSLITTTVNNNNYLGTVFNYTGFYTLNQTTLVGKGLKALNVLIHKTKHYADKPSVMRQLFDAFVAAPLNYGCEIWGFGKSKK
jgi:hypothetical protein